MFRQCLHTGSGSYLPDFRFRVAATCDAISSIPDALQAKDGRVMAGEIANRHLTAYVVQITRLIIAS